MADTAHAEGVSPAGPTKVMFRRPARANTRIASVAPVEAPTSVQLGFRTHADATSEEAFLFSAKTLVPPHGQNEVIVELVPTAPQGSAIPKPQAAEPVQATTSPSGGISMGQRRTPNGWICRAYCGDEKHAQHAMGAISVHQRLMEIRFLSDYAKNRAQARILSFAQAQEWYGVAFVELTIQDQFVSRSDMFLISEALRDRVLYLGQELTYEGFRLRVSDLLLRNSPPPADAGPQGQSPEFEKMHSGLVTPTTQINFLSLSFVYTIMIELSSEMWDQALDGRMLVDWAIERFLKQHSEQFPKYRSNPTVRFVFFGRLRSGLAVQPDESLGSVDVNPDALQAHSPHRDLFHMVAVPQSQHDLHRLSEIAKAHLEVFLNRAIEATHLSKDSLHPRDLFSPARHSNVLQALNIVLEFYNHHHVDRRLDVTGQAITVVTAGNGLYHVENDLSQITATKMLDIGIRKCVIVCMGRPPLHRTPLFEYFSDDPSLRSQYHLQLDPRARECFYERPEWVESLFYHPLMPRGPVGAGYRFALLSKEQWEREFPYIHERHHQFHPGLLLPSLPKPSVVCRAPPLTLSAPHRCDSADNMNQRFRDAHVFVRPAEPRVESVASHQHTVMSTTPHRNTNRVGGGHFKPPKLSLSTTLAMSRKSGVMGEVDRKAAVGAPFIESRWYKHLRNTHVMEPKCPQDDFSFIVSANVLDADLLHGLLRLDLVIQTAGICGWNPTIATQPQQWEALMSSFSSTVDDAPGAATVTSSPPGHRGGSRAVPRFRAERHFSPSRCRVDGHTLSLFSSQTNYTSFDFAEGLHFSFNAELFVFEEVSQSNVEDGAAGNDADDSEVSKPMAIQRLHPTHSVDPGERQSMMDCIANDNGSFVRGMPLPKPGSTVSIGSIQIRSSILFAVRPTNPFVDEVDAGRFHGNADGGNLCALDVYVSAAQVQQLRWQHAQPEKPNESMWAPLCSVAILPLYGERPEYSADSMRDDGRKQYWMTFTHNPATNSRNSLVPLLIKEYLLQRLHQQYQIVCVKRQGNPAAHTSTTHERDEQRETVTTVTTATGSSWSRSLQPLEEVEVTIGHQNQTIKIADDGRGLHIQRTSHKGMYESNTAHQVTYRYLLLNHANLAFHRKSVELEAAIGERACFDWPSLDLYLSTRGTQLPHAFRDRQVCFALLPLEKPSNRRQKPRVPFESFKTFVTSRFSTKLMPREGAQVEDLWKLSTAPLSYVPTQPSTTPGAEVDRPDEKDCRHHFLKAIPLEHKKDDPIDAPDRLLRRPVDPISGQTNHWLFVDDRVMGADIGISPYYHVECAYVMRLSWLCCAATIISDWINGLQHNATNYGIRVVQVPCVYDTSQCGCYLQSQFRAVGDAGVEDTVFRGDLLMRLAKDYGYFPEVCEMNLDCRLVHASGLCFVVSLPESKGVTWSENYVWKTGHVKQRALLDDFLAAAAESNMSLQKASSA